MRSRTIIFSPFVHDKQKEPVDDKDIFDLNCVSKTVSIGCHDEGGRETNDGRKLCNKHHQEAGRFFTTSISAQVLPDPDYLSAAALVSSRLISLQFLLHRSHCGQFVMRSAAPFAKASVHFIQQWPVQNRPVSIRPNPARLPDPEIILQTVFWFACCSCWNALCRYGKDTFLFNPDLEKEAKLLHILPILIG